MAVLQSLRSKVAGAIITVLIAGSLLSFIVDFNSLSSAINSTSSKYAVGKIDGKKIPYKDFQEQVEYQTSIAEIVSGTVSTDEQHQQIRNAAWQHFVDQNLFLKNAAAAGIEVGREELAEMLGQQQEFVDLVQTRDSDASGNVARYLEYVQNNAYTQTFYAKYGSLFSASNTMSELSVKNAMAEHNTTANAQIVLVPYSFQTDSTIKVSSSEIKAYYKNHKNQFKQVANRDIEYALFEVTPSEADLAAANEALVEVYEEFGQTTNMKAFLMRNSEMGLSNYYYKAGELRTVNREINDFVFGNNSGVSPIFNSGNEYYAAKVVDTKNLPDSVYVRHILIQGDAHLADSLLTVVKAGKTPFAELAALYSADQNPNVTPGDLGWMTQSYMIPGFESVISAELNKPYMINTQYGSHIVEITAKTKAIEKKQVAILKKTAVPSKATMNEAYSKANTLATAAAGSLEKLQAAAKEQNVYLRPVNVNEATARYSAVDHAKEVTRWVFEAKKGQASNVITVNQNFLFVVGVSDTHEEGYATVQEAASRIQSVLYNQKVADKTLKEVSEKIQGLTDINAVAEALNQNVTTRDNVSFAGTTQIDPALAGAIAGATEGKVTAPVKGAIGIYVVNVTSRSEGAFYTADDAKSYKAQESQYLTQMILPAMMDATNTVDNRERFF